MAKESRSSGRDAAARKAAEQAAREAEAQTPPEQPAPPEPPKSIYSPPGQEREVNEAIVFHVKRDVDGQPGNDGVEVECRGGVRPSELGFFLALVTGGGKPPPR